MAWNGVITNAGKQLLESYASGDKQLILTRVLTGSGSVTTANMKTATALGQQVATGTIARKENLTNGAKVVLQVGPHTTSYVLTEVGLYAKLSDRDSDVLFFICEKDDTGITIPLASSFPDFVYMLNAVLGISNTDNLQVTVDPTAYVSNATLEATVQQITEQISNIANVIYPVGSIYMSVLDTNPGTLFPGTTWQALKQKFLVGADDSVQKYAGGATGGAETQSVTHSGTVKGHVLTVSEMPAHTHTFTGSAENTAANNRGHTHAVTPAGTISSEGAHTHSVPAHKHGLGSHTHTFTGTPNQATGANNRGHTHTVPKHSHTLGGHTHSFTPSGTVAAANAPHTHTIAHTHTIGLPRPGAGSGVPGAINSAERGNTTFNITSGASSAANSGSANANHSHTFTGTAGTTGAASGNTGEVAATNTGDQSQTHTHTFTASGTIGAASGNTDNSSVFDTGAGTSHTHTFTGTLGNTGAESQNHVHNFTAKGTNANTGGGTAHTHEFEGSTESFGILPPYLAVYMWKRTA